MASNVLCGNCSQRHTIDGVRACYAARYSADKPRGWVAPAAPQTRPSVTLPEREAQRLASAEKAGADLAGLRYRDRKRGPALRGPSKTLEAIRSYGSRQADTSVPF